MVAFVVGLAAIGVWRLAIGWHPAIDHYPVQGVDVSEANGAIDWNAVSAAGADFGYAVATFGAQRRDTAFETNWRGIDQAGLRRGAIHVYSLCQLATDQADAFNTLVPRDETALPAAIDLHYDAGCTSRPDRDVLLGELARFATMIETHTRKPVLLKLSAPIEADYRLSEALPRSIWAIGNVFPPDYTALRWRMWQSSDFRHIEGVDGPIHWDVVTP